MCIVLCELNNYAYVHYKRKGGEERERERRGRGYKYMHKQMLDTHVSLFNFPFCPFLFGAYNILTLSSLYGWLNYHDALSDCNETILVSACPSVYVWSQVFCLGYYVLLIIIIIVFVIIISHF